jgi:hypothetical protein
MFSSSVSGVNSVRSYNILSERADISWLALDLANIPYIVEPIKFATVKPATIYILKNH